MATKMKKQQKKKRWEGSGLVVPSAYRAEVAMLVEGGSDRASPDLRRFAGLLHRLLQQGSTYAEIEALKPLCSFTAEWATRPLPEDSTAAAAAADQRGRDLQRVQGLLADLLLLPNSRPLHKQLLSGLRPLLEQQQQRQAAAGGSAAGSQQAPTLAATVAARIAALAEECLAVDQGQQGEEQSDSKRQEAVLQRALRLGSALAALLANAACKPALLYCAAPAVAALAAGLRAALQPIRGAGSAVAAGSGDGDAAAAGAAAEHITADVMEGLQDCISAMYYLLSAFGRPMLQQQPAAGAAAVTAAGDALLVALQGQALVREAMASAAVALYAAAALPDAPPAALARCFAQGLLLGSGGGSSAAAGQPAPVLLLSDETDAGGSAAAMAGGAADLTVGLVDSHLRQRQAQPHTSSGSGSGSSSSRQGGLAGELSRLPPLNRICAIRGLLAAMPAAVACTPLVARWPKQAGPAGRREEQPWLLLVDGALPAISAAIQSTTDEHFKFHGFSTLAVCLERIRHQQQQAVGQVVDSMVGAAGGGTEQPRQQADAQQAGEAAGQAAALPLLSGARRRQLLQLLWQGFEAPLSQTLQRVHVAFECLLDIIALQQQLAKDQPALVQRLAAGQPGGPLESTDGPAGANKQEEEQADAVLLRIARDLLALDASRKGRYAPLQALVPRVGAARLLALQPGLVPTCLDAMGQHLISSSVAGFFLSLLAQLQREANGTGGAGAAGAAAAGGQAAAGQPDWRAAWLPHLVAALCSGSESQRDHLAAHLLPQLLSADPPALGLLLQQLLPGGSGQGGSSSEGAAAGCLVVLKAARKQQLLSDLDFLPVAGLDAAAVRAALLAAVRSSSEGLRVDALTMVCCHPRTTLLPTPLELEVAAEAVRLTLRCSSSSLKHKTLAPLGRLFMRQRGAVATALSRRDVAPAVREAVAAQRDWLWWLGSTLLGSLYPGSSHERSFMALELLGLLLDASGDLLNPRLPPPSWGPGLAALKPSQFQPFAPDFCSQGTVQLLLAAALDSWERLREAAAAVLLRLPTPLPGAATPAELQPLLLHALRLLGCPRGREADAGAQLVLLLLRKYGGGWGAGGSGGGCAWLLDLAAGTVQAPATEQQQQQAGGATEQQEAGTSAQPAAAAGQEGPAADEQQADALWSFLSSGCRLLEQRVQLAQQDMLGACRGGLALGVLLALRYAIPHVPWRRLAEAPPRPGRDWRALVERLLALSYAVAELTLPVLSKPQDQNTDAADVHADDVAFEDEEETAGDGEGGDALGPRAQIINTACWQSSKECGLLLGALARALPIGGAAGLLTSAQLSFMADYFTNALCCLKHNGAVDKTQQGFAALCERLLQQADPSLRQLPQRCLSRLLEFARRPDQGRGDIVRRSAGLPFAVVAIFYSEPENSQKVLLQRGMAELLATANDTAAESWPRVHALNCMRAAFQDSNLAVDTSAFLAEGLQTAILGMAAPQWEVRNAASLCYTALLVRVLGFRNAAGKGTPAAKRAPTAPDFFARHPQLHPFLLRQLAAATAALEEAGAGGAAPSSNGPADKGVGASSGGGSTAVHPAMFPVLVLLSRLRSSQHNRLVGTAAAGISSLAEQQLSPAAFAPLLQRCAAARPAAVRALAAAALPPLLPPERQPAAAAALAEAVAEGMAAAVGAARGGAAAALRPSFNSLHGQLLQLRALLEAAAATADAEAAAALLGAVASQLTKAAPAACTLGSGSSAGGSLVPAAVSLEYIRAAAAAAELLPLARRAGGEEATEAAIAGAAWLGAVQRRCWVEIERSGLVEPPRDYCSPQLSFAFKHAAQMCLSLALQQQQGSSRDSAFAVPGGGSLLPQLATALRSHLYEVRGAALKVLLRHLQQEQQLVGAAATAAVPSSGQQQLFSPQQQQHQLRSLLRQQLAEETHHKAQRRLLALLALLPPGAGEAAAAGGAAGSTTASNVAAEFGAMLARASQAADSRVKQHAVECLGPLLAQLLAQQGGMPAGGSGHGSSGGSTPASPASAAEQLLGVASDCAQPWQLPELRLAAAAAVAASGLLQLDPAQSEAAAEAAAAAWRVLLVLLEDEDEEVRDAAAAAASAAMSAFGSSSGSNSGSGGGGTDAAGAAAEPASPSDERVLRRLFPALAARFGPHAALLALLRRLCCPAAVAAAAEGGCAAPGDASEGTAPAARGAASAQERERAAKIFDREPDNMHEEPVLVAQLAAATLAQLLPQADATAAAGAAAAADTRAWAGVALHQLQQAAAAAAEDSGLLQDPDQFADLYRCWLALWASAHLPAGGSSWDADVAAAVGPLAAAAQDVVRGMVPQLAAAAAAAAAAWQHRGDADKMLADSGSHALLRFLV